MEVIMSISSIGMSYSQMQNTSGALNIKGLETTEGTSAKSKPMGPPPPKDDQGSGNMDSVSLSEEATSQYTIAGTTVSKSVFEQYDTDNNGKISNSEANAYKSDHPDKTDETEESSNAELIDQMKKATEENEETGKTTETATSPYSPFSNASFRAESGSNFSAVA